MAQKPAATPGQRSLKPHQIEAYAASIEHHSSLTYVFAFGFVSTFALFCAGAFAALLTVIPTPFGERVAAAHPVAVRTLLLVFALGFMCAMALMACVFQYGIMKYRYYRDLLKTGDPAYIPPNTTKFTYPAVVALVFMISCSIAGTIIAVTLIWIS